MCKYGVAVTIVGLLEPIVAHAGPGIRAPTGRMHEGRCCWVPAVPQFCPCPMQPCSPRSFIALAFPSRWRPLFPLGDFSAQLPTDIVLHVIFLFSLQLALGFSSLPRASPACLFPAQALVSVFSCPPSLGPHGGLHLVLTRLALRIALPGQPQTPTTGAWPLCEVLRPCPYFILPPTSQGSRWQRPLPLPTECDNKNAMEIPPPYYLGEA